MKKEYSKLYYWYRYRINFFTHGLGISHHQAYAINYKGNN